MERRGAAFTNDGPELCCLRLYWSLTLLFQTGLLVWYVSKQTILQLGFCVGTCVRIQLLFLRRSCTAVCVFYTWAGCAASENPIYTMTSDQSRLPAEFKHINKRRKRKQQ